MGTRLDVMAKNTLQRSLTTLGYRTVDVQDDVDCLAQPCFLPFPELEKKTANYCHFCMLRAEMCSLNSYVDILILRTSECDCLWLVFNC